MHVTDPVCNMQIESATAVASAVFQGHTYYFCCQPCHDQFQKAPERYVGTSAEARKPQRPRR